MLALKHWVVIGDVLSAAKPAAQVVQRLMTNERYVIPFNPRLTDLQVLEANHKYNSAANQYLQPVVNSTQALKGKKIDVVNLCVHPTLGLGLLPDISEMGVKNVFIQPGAESDDILNFCRQQGLDVHQGCVLREMGSGEH